MEDKIQAEIFREFHNKYCLKNSNPRCCIFAVPNGGNRNVVEAIKMKSTGTLAGVSDLIVLMPNRCIFIEVKTDVGKQSDKQKEFESTVKLLGFEYYVVRNINDFNLIINTPLTTKQ